MRSSRAVVVWIAAAAALVPLFSDAAAFGGETGVDHARDGTAAWGFYVYMAGDNSLDDFTVLDFNEMERVGSTDEVRIVVQIDRQGESAKRYLVRKDADDRTITSPVVEDIGEIDMSKNASLESFLKWAMETYPAERTDLHIWDHGDGIFRDARGFCFDTGGKMHLWELAAALRNVARWRGTERAVDVVSFDVCSLAHVETAYAVAPWADYLVASQAEAPDIGMYYATPLQALAGNPRMSARDFAMELVTGYAQAYSPGGPHYQEQYSATLSAVDLRALESKALPAIDAVASGFLRDLRATESGLRSVIARAQVYKYPDARDATDLMNLIDGTEWPTPWSDLHRANARNASEALNATVIANFRLSMDFNGSNHQTYPVDRANGMNIYTGSNPRYADASFMPYAQRSWDDLLSRLYGLSNRPPSLRHIAHPDTLDEQGPYRIEAEVQDDDIASVGITYQLDDGATATAAVEIRWGLMPGDPAAVAGLIPGQPRGTEVRYLIAARDERGHVTYSPPTAVPDSPATWNLFTVRTDNPNPPEVRAPVPGPDPSVDEGGELAFAIEPYDPDGTELFVAWTVDGRPAGEGTSFVYAPSYDDAGSHIVEATVSDFRLNASYAWNVTVNPVNRPPTVAIDASDLLPGNRTRLGAAATLIAEASDPDGDPLEIVWDTDFDGGFDPVETGARITVTFDRPGTVTIALRASDGMALSTALLTVQVLEGPEARVSPALAVATPGSEVLLDGTGSQPLDIPIASYRWDFGDGSSGSGASARHAYADRGVYTATLTITDEMGGSGSATAIVYVVSSTDLSPLPSIEPAPAVAGYPAHFRWTGALPDEDLGIGLVHARWTFGDGKNASGREVSHVYNRTGTFEVSFALRDSIGREGLWTGTVRVVTEDNLPPIASAFAVYAEVPVFQRVRFEGNRSSDPDGLIVSYLWDFGDGQHGSGAVTNHTFIHGGNFTVTLTVIDERGGADSTTVWIRVHPPHDSGWGAFWSLGRTPFFIQFPVGLALIGLYAFSWLRSEEEGRGKGGRG